MDGKMIGGRKPMMNREAEEAFRARAMLEEMQQARHGVRINPDAGDDARFPERLKLSIPEPSREQMLTDVERLVVMVKNAEGAALKAQDAAQMARAAADKALADSGRVIWAVMFGAGVGAGIGFLSGFI